MSGVTKATTTDIASRPTDAPAEAGPRPKAGEFDQLVEAKAARRQSHGRTPGGQAEEGQKGTTLENARDEAAASRLRVGSEGDGESGEGFGGQGSRREAEASLREGYLMPGDVAGTAAIRGAAGAAPVADPGRAADAVARIEQIAQQIVQAVELRMGPNGAGEIKLELGLGSLGTVNVSLLRSEEGKIRVGFETTNAETASLIKSRAGDLVTTLETRGVSLSGITVQGPDQASFRLEPPSAAAEAATPAAFRANEPTPPPAPAAGGQEAQQRHAYDEDRQQRRRPQAEAEDPDE